MDFNIYRVVKSRQKINTSLARGPSNVLTATKHPLWEAVCMR